MKPLLLFLIAAMILAACSKKTAPTASATSSKASAPAAGAYSEEAANREVSTATTDSKKATGQNIYTAKCGKCHALRSPGEFTRQQWKPILDRMAVKAMLSDAEKAELTFYLNANAKK